MQIEEKEGVVGLSPGTFHNLGGQVRRWVQQLKLRRDNRQVAKRKDGVMETKKRKCCKKENVINCPVLMRVGSDREKEVTTGFIIIPGCRGGWGI